MKVFESDCYTGERTERASYNNSVSLFHKFCLERFKSRLSVIKSVKLEIVQDDVKYKSRERISLNLHYNCTHC